MGNAGFKSAVSACLEAAISSVTGSRTASKSNQCVQVLKYLAELYSTLQAPGANCQQICEAAKSNNATSMLIQHQNLLDTIQWWQIIGVSTLVVIILLIIVNLFVHCSSVRNQRAAYPEETGEKREAFAAREGSQTSPRL